MSFLKFLWRKWLRLAQAIGNFQAQVILTFFYVVILAPLGFVYRFLADPLKIRGRPRSNWGKWEHPKETLESARRQY